MSHPQKLQLDPTALQQVKDEMEKLQEAGFIAKLFVGLKDFGLWLIDWLIDWLVKSLTLDNRALHAKNNKIALLKLT